LKLADNLPHPQKPTMHAVNSVSASARMYPPPFLLLGPALKAARSSVQLFIFAQSNRRQNNHSPILPSHESRDVRTVHTTRNVESGVSPTHHRIAMPSRQPHHPNTKSTCRSHNIVEPFCPCPPIRKARGCASYASRSTRRSLCMPCTSHTYVTRHT
jgi:hypothetical protein